MVSRERVLEIEALDLWRSLRSDAPPSNLSGAEMLAMLIATAPTVSYDRLQSPHLRSSQITRPTGPQA